MTPAMALAAALRALADAAGEGLIDGGEVAIRPGFLAVRVEQGGDVVRRSVSLVEIRLVHDAEHFVRAEVVSAVAQARP